MIGQAIADCIGGRFAGDFWLDITGDHWCQRQNCLMSCRAIMQSPGSGEETAKRTFGRGAMQLKTFSNLFFWRGDKSCPIVPSKFYSFLVCWVFGVLRSVHCSPSILEKRTFAEIFLFTIETPWLELSGRWYSSTVLLARNLNAKGGPNIRRLLYWWVP